MTAVWLVSLYFVALSTFLGLDIVGKVPATMYALVLVALGTLAAVAIVGAFYIQAYAAALDDDGLRFLAIGSAALASAAAGAGLVAIGRIARGLLGLASRTKSRP
jgi:hypothetical protein